MKNKANPKAGNGDLIGMDEAIAMLKTTRPTFYRWLKTGKLKGMKVGRQWRFYADDVRRFLKGESLRWDLPADIAPLIAALREKAGEKADSVTSLSDAERVALAASLVFKAGVALKASDIHLDSVGDKARLRYRINGVLQVVAEFDSRLLPALIARFKGIAGGAIDIKNLPQDYRIPYEEGGQRYDIRMAFLPALAGETMSARISQREIQVGGLDWLDLNPGARKLLDRAMAARSGMVVFSGPTGSGKTTALYAAIKQVATPANKVVSIEDPVEGALPGVVQVMVNASVPFPAALKATLRADANVIVVGQLSDGETVPLAVKAAMTGHLVLTAMHAASAARAIRRIVEMGAPAYDVSEGVRLVTSQRLVRRVCPECSVNDSPTADQLKLAAKAAAEGGLDFDAQPRKFRKAVGCPKCNMTGFKGRKVAFEAIEVTPVIAKLVRDGAPEEEIQAQAVRQGMLTMAADAVRRACAGETTLTEAMVETGEL